jgi:hypothetical protein
MNCPVCGSEELSEETQFASFESHARFRDWEPGILQWKDLTVGAERARICLDCGYLLLFVGVAALAKLKAGRPPV